jgi:hypothetical protein
METRLMRVLALLCLLPLIGCVDTDRREGFAATGPNSFLYSARTSTVMTENDDGVAERIRRDWLAEALAAHGMCLTGFVIDTRRFVPNPPTDAGPQFSTGGDIVYSGRCMAPGAPPPAPVPLAPAPAVPPVRG